MATDAGIDPQRRLEALRRYYTLAGALVAGAFQSRLDWLKSLDDVIEEFDKRGVNAGRVKASLVGGQYNSLFERYLQAFGRIQAPPGAEDFHNRWMRWLERLTRANFCLGDGASRSDFKLLEEAVSSLAEARPLLVAVTQVTQALAPDLIPKMDEMRRGAPRAAPPPAPMPERTPTPAAGATPAAATGKGPVRVAAKTVDQKQQTPGRKRR